MTFFLYFRTSTSIVPAANEELLLPESPPEIGGEVDCTEESVAQQSKRKRNDDVNSQMAVFLRKVDAVINQEDDKHTGFFQMMRHKLESFPDRMAEDLKIEMLTWLHEKLVGNELVEWKRNKRNKLWRLIKQHIAIVSCPYC